MFSLMDVNGDMMLGREEIYEFITKILGTKVSIEVVDTYVRAMDVDQDGVVSFTDLLDCVALLKKRHKLAEWYFYCFACE